MRAVCFVLLLASTSLFSQWSIESSFNSVDIGRNQNLLVKYQWNKLSINGGFKYNFNRPNSFPNSFTYRKSFWASNTIQHLGLELGLQIKLIEKENFDLFGFYSAQITHSDIRMDNRNIDGISEPQIIGPFLAIENNIGLGLNVYFSESLYFISKVGGGILLVESNQNNSNTFITGGGSWEFSHLVGMGLGWRFK